MKSLKLFSFGNGKFLFLVLVIFSTHFADAQEKSAGTISGYIYGPGSKPLKGTYISLSKRGDKSKDHKSITVDSSGFFIFDNVPNGLYTLYCSKYQCRTVYIDSITVNNDHVVLEVHLKKERDYFFNQPLLKLNVHQGWRTMGEVSLGLGVYDDGGRIHLETLSALELGCQFNFSPSHFIIGPSLSINGSAFILQGGLSLIYFTDFDRKTLYINPHLGLTFNTYCDLYFGYNIPLMRNDMKSMVNRFTVTLAVPLLDRDWVGGSNWKRYYYNSKKKKLKRKRWY